MPVVFLDNGDRRMCVLFILYILDFFRPKGRFLARFVYCILSKFWPESNIISESNILNKGNFSQVHSFSV
jgi:hypothetical protein